jgi:peptidoglycan/xylan/chitin deacetylase (PgdA/CDA1 family)
MSRLLSERLAGTRAAGGRCEVKECLILQYHRVALLVHDPLRLAVQPYNFERQMEYLATCFNVISMNELKQHLETAMPFRAGTVVVTFDGGYSDVLYAAKDVLERFEIPATVFLPSVHLIERTQFWWDVLEDVLIAGGPHDPLVIDVDGETRCWPLASQHDRFQAFDDLYTILSDKAPPKQSEIVAEIARFLDCPSDERDGHVALSAQEIRRLDEGELITIGGHTHSCVKLSSLPEGEQVREIGRNKQALEEVLGHGVEYFSYPFGHEGSPTATTKEILRNFGFTLSCHACSDTVSIAGTTCPYELPRLKVRDGNPFTFYRCLRTFLG